MINNGGRDEQQAYTICEIYSTGGGVCALLAPGWAGPPYLKTRLSAKGFNILQVSFPTRGEVSGVSVQFSWDGEIFHSADVGLPRPWQLLPSVSYGKGWTTISVPAVAAFGLGEARFFLEKPGTCWFRWNINFKDKNIESIKIERIVEVAPSTGADLDFTMRLGGPDLARAMFGKDFFERQSGVAHEQMMDPEMRALMVIRRFLEAARARTMEDVKLPKGDVKKTAD
ncbi:MAG: hypothetical protein D6690_10030, partial [Nitrospirae bacterium]